MTHALATGLRRKIAFVADAYDFVAKAQRKQYFRGRRKRETIRIPEFLSTLRQLGLMV